MARKISTTIYVDAEQLARLKALSDKTKLPMAEYWRQALDLILAKHEGAK